MTAYRICATVSDLCFARLAFSATAVLTIALGIGVNVAVFNLIYAVLIDSLPYRNSNRLVHLAETHPDFSSYQVAAPDFFDWQKTAKSFDGMGERCLSPGSE